MHDVEVWLPHIGCVALVALHVENGCTVERPLRDLRPKWVTYGSSITHGMSGTAYFQVSRNHIIPPSGPPEPDWARCKVG